MGKIWDEELGKELGDEKITPPPLNIWEAKEEGEYIAGRITKISEGKYGIEARIKEHEEDEDADALLLPAHRLLQARIELLNVGDIVKVTYMGTERTQGGREVKVYEVMRRGA